MLLRRLIPLAFLLSIFFIVNPLAASANTPLRVLSWNIQFGQGTDGVTNYDRTATWLAKMNPDLIALCEMPPDKVSTLVSLLNQKTGRTWNSHFVPKFPGSPEGNLIISTYSFTATSSQYLSYSRSIAQVTINVGGRNINFFATHLDHTSSSLRLAQANELADWTANFAMPRIVAGDLNAGNDTPEVIRLLNIYQDSWVDALNLNSAFAYPDNPVWMNTRTRRWRIDFILFAADASTFAARSSNIPDTRDLNNTHVVNALGTADDKGVRPSDHNFVVSDFDVLSAAPPPPPAPVIFTQSGDRAIAMHSVLFTSEPFSVRSPLNLSSDQRTRIMLFATNFDPAPGEPLLVHAVDARGVGYDLVVEKMLKVSGFNWLWSITVRLPDDQAINGDLRLTATFRGAVSDTVRVGIRAP